MYFLTKSVFNNGGLPREFRMFGIDDCCCKGANIVDCKNEDQGTISSELPFSGSLVFTTSRFPGRVLLEFKLFRFPVVELFSLTVPEGDTAEFGCAKTIGP